MSAHSFYMGGAFFLFLYSLSLCVAFWLRRGGKRFGNFLSIWWGGALGGCDRYFLELCIWVKKSRLLATTGENIRATVDSGWYRGWYPDCHIELFISVLYYFYLLYPS